MELFDVEPQYSEYLRDESRLNGSAEKIAFPVTEEELCALLRSRDSEPLTIQGARTGISGGAVPRGGQIINLSRMNRILGLRRDQNDFSLIVQPGVLLTEIDEFLQQKSADTAGWDRQALTALEDFQEVSHFFTPDPTERSASIGGMAASNASGARSFAYGPIRNHIRSLKVVLVDGSVLALSRGLRSGDRSLRSGDRNLRAKGRNFVLPTAGRIIEGRIPGYVMPEVKNAAGYYAAENMDLLDLFIGSEGTLGILTEIEIALTPLPAQIWGIMAFLPDEAQTVRFVQAVRGDVPLEEAPPAGQPAAIEFFDARALDLLRSQKSNNPAFAELPEIPEEYPMAVFVEYHADTEEEAEERVFALAAILTHCGGSEEATWMASTPREMERLKDFRHALPEAINLIIDERKRTHPGLAKLGTDMAVPDKALSDVLELYRRGLEETGLQYVKMGHIGNNHVHVNILPATPQEYEQGKDLYRRWAEKVVAFGGTVSAEHGIGKIKGELLEIMYGRRAIEEMIALKSCFDPDLILNRGNMYALG